MRLHLTHSPEPVLPKAWLIVPVPIREDVSVLIQIPRDFTTVEAEKVARVLVALGEGEAA